MPDAIDRGMPARQPGAQRMPSVDPAEWTDEVRSFFAMMEGEDAYRNGSKYNFSHWFANHPELATHWLRYNQALTRGELDPVLRELVILRVAHRFGSDYEWNLHAQISAAMGIGPEHLDAVRQGPAAALWNDLERLCLRAADALCQRHDIDDALWQALSARLGRKEVIELLFLIGSYTLLAWVLRAVRMPVEDL